MKSTQLQQIESINFLKVVNNSLNKTIAPVEKVNRIYINTLIPGFNYINHLGEVVSPNKCAFL